MGTHNIVLFESHFERQKVILVSFSGLTIGSKFKFGECVCMKTQEGLCSPVMTIGDTKPQLCKFNFVHLGINRGTFGWLSPDQHVEVIAPHREDS